MAGGGGSKGGLRPGEGWVLQTSLPCLALRPRSHTRLLKEEKGSRRSSYWDEYRSSVSSLPPPCVGRKETPSWGPNREAWAAGSWQGHKEPQQRSEGGEGAHGDGENVAGAT